MKYCAEEIADWAANVRYDELPTNVVKKIKLSIRDGLGCGLFGSTLEVSEIIRKGLGVEGRTSGESVIWGTSYRALPIEATLINGTAVQSFELDDSCVGAQFHGSCALLPVILAIADQRKNVTGKQMIEAEAIGWEVGVRFSRCMGQNAMRSGWFAVAMYETIAASAAAGIALRLDTEKLANCISLGVLQGCGFIAAQYEGMAKRLYAGRAAQNGLLAAILAERGFTAPKQAIEHPSGGFCATLAGGAPYDIGQLTADLGQKFAAENIRFKIYSSAGGIHQALDALASLREEHPEIGPDTIDEIVVYLDEAIFRRVGLPYTPKDTTTAQYNAAYTIAVFLLEGQAFVNQYRPELLSNPKILDLARRIKPVSDPELNSDFSKSSSHDLQTRIRVVLKGGKQFERVAYRGDRVVTDEELVHKYQDLSTKALVKGQVDKLASRVDTLEDLEDVSALSSLTAAAH